MYYLNVNLKDFSAAHRLVKGYRGKCNHLHGHNYALKVVIAAQAVGADGLVIDFSEVRHLSNEWVQKNLDHATLVYQEDSELLQFVQTEQQKHYLFADNTSAEVLAAEIFTHLQEIFAYAAKKYAQEFSLHQVELWESRECGVVYSEKSAVVEGLSCGQ